MALFRGQMKQQVSKPSSKNPKGVMYFRESGIDYTLDVSRVFDKLYNEE